MALPNLVETLDLKTPQTLITMTDRVRPAATFLFDRYFYTNANTDIYDTEDILVERKDKYGRVVAPLVKKGWKNSTRRTFSTTVLRAGRIAPRRILTIADMMQRGYGEQLINSDRSPSDRAVAITMEDLTDMRNSIKRRMEVMAADLLVNNKYTLTYEKSDANGADEDVEPQEVSFIDSTEGNPTAYAPATMWNKGGDVYADLRAMCRQLDENGGRAVDLVLGANAAAALLANEKIAKMLDNRRMEYGQLAPQIYAQGAVLHGMLNVDGRLLNIIEYREQYHNASGNLVPYFPADNALLISEKCCRALYAAVIQMEQLDMQFHTYYKPVVPKYMGDAEKDELDIRMTSRPLLVPELIGGWISAKVTGTV